MSSQATMRKPAVSGAFYPADADALKSMVQGMLMRAGRPVEAGLPKALVVPHAGYAYSGNVAATAFALLSHWNASIHRVVLLGPSHHFSFNGFAIPSVSAFITPLGEVPLADNLQKTLEDIPDVSTNDAIHEPEHCLEVQLPFLQLVFPTFVTIPVLTGNASAEEVAALIEQSWGDHETLVIISTDLSHFNDDFTAKRMDARTCHAIESFDYECLHSEHACGYIALRGMLLAARNHGLGVHTLMLSNSGDATGDHSRVVGYGAWAFYENA